ncbi:MAG: hypothetical protein AAGC64_13735 [Bacteroidota bacterium]
MMRIFRILIILCFINTGGCQASKLAFIVESAIKTVTEDYPEKEQLKAYEALEQFVLQGNFNARLFLGCEYLTGVRREKNVDLGLQYLTEGVESGSTEAMFCLSRHYYREKQFYDYVKTLEQCSQMGDVFCKVELGSFLLDEKSISFAYVGGVKNLDYQDINKAFKLLDSASEAGSTDANFILGEQYFYGKHVEKDYEKAKAYFEKCLEDPYFSSFDIVEEYLRKID